MNVKLGDIVEAAQVIRELTEVRVPAKVAYRISVAADRIMRHAQRAEKVRADMITSYGTKQEDGNYMVPPEKVEEFRDELNALYDEEVELNLVPINVDALGEVMISPLTMYKLGFLWETGPSQ